MHCKILQFFAKDMLFKRCGICRSRILPVQTDECGNGLHYCERCAKEITTFEHNFSIKMVILDIHTDQTLAVTIYDKVAEEFVGCSANEISEKFAENPDYWRLLESVACGQFIEAITDRSNKFKLTYLSLMLPGEPTLFSILNKITSKGLQYHFSL